VVSHLSLLVSDARGSVTSVAVITSAVEVCFDTSNSAAAAPVALKKMILFNDLVDFFNQDNQRPRGY
jgi:hypothetical protein